MSAWRTLWLWVLAKTRFSLSAVCELSHGMGLYNDFHKDQDGILEDPYRNTLRRCRRCGKRFCSGGEL